jgi:hypothetical protein
LEFYTDNLTFETAVNLTGLDRKKLNKPRQIEDGDE